MYSLAQKALETPGVRRLFRWWNQLRIAQYMRSEKRKKDADPKNLMNFEKKIFSQNGEDGIIAEIFNRIGTTNKYFVEFGIENGQECNCRYLVENQQWSGLWIDGSADNVRQAQHHYQQFPVKITNHFINRDNITSIFSANHVPRQFDLLVIDIDGNDYWVWQQIQNFKPRVVIIEYNAAYLPDEDWIMPYNPNHRFNSTAHFGASLAAYTKLARELGYSLVGCDSAGVNAFYVLTDLAIRHFSYSEAGPEYHYVSPKYRNLTFGWPRVS